MLNLQRSPGIQKGRWNLAGQLYSGRYGAGTENEEIMPETNWQGYHSKHSFAGGARQRGVCGSRIYFRKG